MGQFFYTEDDDETEEQICGNVETKREIIRPTSCPAFRSTNSALTPVTVIHSHTTKLVEHQHHSD